MKFRIELLPLVPCNRHIPHEPQHQHYTAYLRIAAGTKPTLQVEIIWKCLDKIWKTTKNIKKFCSTDSLYKSTELSTKLQFFLHLVWVRYSLIVSTQSSISRRVSTFVDGTIVLKIDAN